MEVGVVTDRGIEGRYFEFHSISYCHADVWIYHSTQSCLVQGAADASCDLMPGKLADTAHVFGEIGTLQCKKIG